MTGRDPVPVSLPRGWRMMRLKHLCSRNADYAAKESASEYVDEGVRFLRTTDITDVGELTSSGGVCLPAPMLRDYLLQTGNLLLSRSGTLGRSFLYRGADVHGP